MHGFSPMSVVPERIILRDVETDAVVEVAADDLDSAGDSMEGAA